MIAYTFLVIIGGAVALAVPSGLIEARWWDTNKRPLSHAALAKIRIAAGVLLFGIAQWISPSWSLFILIPAMAAAFAIVHRLTMNTKRKSTRWDYLGPRIRGPRESWYDDIWWHWTRKLEHTEKQFDYARFQPAWHYYYADTSLISPFAACVAFELSILALSTWAYFHFTNI